jgi:hypothetical protein
LADVLAWKEGEGNDVHLLREGPPSKRLLDALDVPTGQTVTFVPNFTADAGIEVDATTGVVRALAHPDPTFPKLNNFILTAITDAAQTVQIRVQVHDEVKDLWLSPPALTVRKDAGCRFTVLARFTDESVGDVTEWTDIKFQSDDPSITVEADGSLQSNADTGGATVTATLTLASPATNKTSFPASALARPSWTDYAKTAKVEFVAGRIAPNLSDADSPAPDSVKSVVENAVNVLFIAEGFRNEQRFDYRNIVNTITRVMRGGEEAYAAAFEPFDLLKNSINYWTLFVPSEQSGLSIHGEHVIVPGPQMFMLGPDVVERPRDVPWLWGEFLHEAGMPLLSDGARTLPDLVADWQKLYGPHVTEGPMNVLYQSWQIYVRHGPINDLDTAFGMHLDSRGISASRHDAVEIKTDPRRAGKKAIDELIPNLQVGGFPIGERWKRDGPDNGLISFICLTDRKAGLESGLAGFFAVGTGKYERSLLKAAPDSGVSIEVLPVRNTYRHLEASVVAHELGHALGVGDEYGGGGGSDLGDHPVQQPPFPNLQAKVAVAPVPVPPAARQYHADSIKWIYPRMLKAGSLTKEPDAGDIQADGIHVQMRLSDSRAFATGDIVRFRGVPALLAASEDLPRKAGLFKVAERQDGKLRLTPVMPVSGNNDVTDVAIASFDPGKLLNNLIPGQDLALVAPRRENGDEVLLVAKVIRDHIETTDGPLNAPRADPTAACVGTVDDIVTPTNLPSLTRRPRTKADIIGIYEGGSEFDCGVFRPAGRCRMRNQDIITTPFCHVCRYVIVDRVDPAVHPRLDALYPEVKG